MNGEEEKSVRVKRDVMVIVKVKDGRKEDHQ